MYIGFFLSNFFFFLCSLRSKPDKYRMSSCFATSFHYNIFQKFLSIILVISIFFFEILSILIEMVEKEFFCLEIRIIFIKKSDSFGNSSKGVFRILPIVEISRNNIFFLLFFVWSRLYFFFYILSRFKE